VEIVTEAKFEEGFLYETVHRAKDMAWYKETRTMWIPLHLLKELERVEEERPYLQLPIYAPRRGECKSEEAEVEETSDEEGSTGRGVIVIDI